MIFESCHRRLMRTWICRIFERYVPCDFITPLIFNIFRYGLALLYLGTLFIVIGYHNPWISFTRYVGLSMMVIGVICLIVASIHGLTRCIKQNHINDVNANGDAGVSAISGGNGLRENDGFSYSRDEKKDLPCYEEAIDFDLPSYEEAQALRLNPRFLPPDVVSSSLIDSVRSTDRRKNRRKSSTDMGQDRRPLSIVGSIRRPTIPRETGGLQQPEEVEVCGRTSLPLCPLPPLHNQIIEIEDSEDDAGPGSIFPPDDHRRYSSSSFESVSNDDEEEEEENLSETRNLKRTENRSNPSLVCESWSLRDSELDTYSNARTNQRESEDWLKEDRARTANNVRL